MYPNEAIVLLQPTPMAAPRYGFYHRWIKVHQYYDSLTDFQQIPLLAGEAVSEPPESPKPVRSVNPGLQVPEWPEWVYEEQIKGTVTIRVQLGRSGNVLDATIVNSPFPRLDDLILEAAKNWNFESTSGDTDADVIIKELPRELDFSIAPAPPTAESVGP